MVKFGGGRGEVGGKWLQTHETQPSPGHWHRHRHLQTESTPQGTRSGIDSASQISPKTFQIDAQREFQHAPCRITNSHLENLSSCKLCECIIKKAEMHFYCENTCVFKDSDFLTVVAWAHHLITRSLEKRLEKRCPRCPTTLPNDLSKSLASWKCLCDRFGRILVSQMTFQRGPLRVPGAFKNVFFQAWAPRKPPNRCWIILGCCVGFKIKSKDCLSLQFWIACRQRL